MPDWVLNINDLAGLDSVIFEEEKSELMCVGEKVKLAAFVYLRPKQSICEDSVLGVSAVVRLKVTNNNSKNQRRRNSDF